MPTLILAFEGTMQAWGSGSKFDTRQTENIPTKSGVIGMIGSAMGRKRGESLEDLNELKLTIRVDQPGRKVTDLQTMKVSGVKDLYLGRKVYLSDAKFLVCLSHPDQAFLEAIQDALNHPIYPISLGRRNCVPTGNLVRGIKAEDGTEVVKTFPWLAQSDDKKNKKNYSQPFSNPSSLPVFVEGKAGFRQFRMKDHPVSFDRKNRQYQTRVFSETAPIKTDSLNQNSAKIAQDHLAASNPSQDSADIDFFKEACNVSE